MDDLPDGRAILENDAAVDEAGLELLILGVVRAGTDANLNPSQKTIRRAIPKTPKLRERIVCCVSLGDNPHVPVVCGVLNGIATIRLEGFYLCDEVLRVEQLPDVRGCAASVVPFSRVVTLDFVSRCVCVARPW